MSDEPRAEYRGCFHAWWCPACEETQETWDDPREDDDLRCENCGWTGRLEA